MGRWVAGWVALALSAVASRAEAGGLYFSDRGVRPLGRAGAFVAGADDAGSIAYNPAGLAFTGHQLLIDASWVQFRSVYQRKALLEQVDPNTGQPTGQTFTQTFPAVEGTTPVLPIPTIVYANPLGQKELNFALGVWAPYAAIMSYPEQVNGQPAPQRYSMLSMDGSALAIPGVYASYKPKALNDQLALGAGVEMLVGYLQTSVVFSACVPVRFVCAPEQPEYDATSQLRVGPNIAPSGVIGAIFVPSEFIRLGASFHLPFWISSPATVSVRLPSASVFDNASQDGDEAEVDFQLPYTLRVGVEIRPIERLRVEAGIAYEGWAMHDEISVAPRNIVLRNVEAFPPEYKVGPISIQRGFQNSWSTRLGGEIGLPVGDYVIDARAGIMYEKSAIPPAMVNAASIDLDKVTLALGGSLHIGKWRFDGVIARVMGMPVNVGLDEQRVVQVNPVQANPAPTPHYINAGKYQADATVLGVGLVYQFDDAAKSPAGGSPVEPPTKPGSAPPPEQPRTAKPKTEKEGDQEFEKAFEKEVGE
jgi:long-chain fatty acid transport protein